MMTIFRALALAGLVLLSWPAMAVQPDEILPDARLEARARALSAQLRCMVCQNESIDDSEASLAKDLRILVRERLQAGDSDEQVRSYLVQRYGDFILLKPPFKLETLALWGAPFLVLLCGGIAIVFASRRRIRDAAPRLSESERARLEALLGADKSPEGADKSPEP
ncbi:cytochrome c-type biogenesis protein [Methylocapsa palsarum]